MFRRIDKPMIDTDEQFVFFNSPAVGTMSDGSVHHIELGLGWEASNPFSMQMSIVLTSGSVAVTEDEFPHGLTCMRCNLPIDNGTVACSVAAAGTYDELWCIACSRNEIEILQEETWYISLDHVREALAYPPDYQPGDGDVRITRPSVDMLMFRLGQESSKRMYMNVPLYRISMFVKEIDEYLDSSEQQAMRAAYLDHGLEQLERLGNGEIDD